MGNANPFACTNKWPRVSTGGMVTPCLNWACGGHFGSRLATTGSPHLIGLRVPCVSHGIGFVDCRGTGSHHYGGPGPCMVGIAWRRMASRGHLLGWSQPSKSPGIHPYTGRAHSVADSASAHPRRWRPSGCPSTSQRENGTWLRWRAPRWGWCIRWRWQSWEDHQSIHWWNPHHQWSLQGGEAPGTNQPAHRQGILHGKLRTARYWTKQTKGRSRS